MESEVIHALCAFEMAAKRHEKIKTRKRARAWVCMYLRVHEKFKPRKMAGAGKSEREANASTENVRDREESKERTRN